MKEKTRHQEIRKRPSQPAVKIVVDSEPDATFHEDEEVGKMLVRLVGPWRELMEERERNSQDGGEQDWTKGRALR